MTGSERWTFYRCTRTMWYSLKYFRQFFWSIGYIHPMLTSIRTMLISSFHFASILTQSKHLIFYVFNLATTEIKPTKKICLNIHWAARRRRNAFRKWPTIKNATLIDSCDQITIHATHMYIVIVIELAIGHCNDKRWWRTAGRAHANEREFYILCLATNNNNNKWSESWCVRCACVLIIKWEMRGGSRERRVSCAYLS